MRVFWSIMLVLLVGTVGLVLAAVGNSRGPVLPATSGDGPAASAAEPGHVAHGHVASGHVEALGPGAQAELARGHVVSEAPVEAAGSIPSAGDAAATGAPEAPQVSGISAAIAPAEGPAVAASQPGSDPAAAAVESAPGLTETVMVGEEVGRAGARVPDAAPGAALVVAAETAEVATMRVAPEAVDAAVDVAGDRRDLKPEVPPDAGPAPAGPGAEPGAGTAVETVAGPDAEPSAESGTGVGQSVVSPLMDSVPEGLRGPATRDGPIEPTDPGSIRGAAAMLGNIIRQSYEVPGVDFVGRLASAGRWIPVPDVKRVFPDAGRGYLVPVPRDQFLVADDGSGGHVRVVVPRAEFAEVMAAVRASAVLVAEEGADAEAGTGADEGRYVAQVSGRRAGLLRVGPGVMPDGSYGLLLEYVADPPDPANAARGPSYEVQEDGSIRLSNGSVIRGRGTRERPFEVGWELLVSAERQYQPRNGMTRLPDWCSALHERYVRITGHLLSPLMMDDTDQILLMRDQWDGCCIGVPPSPYDAVEVQLLRPVSLVREQLNYGSITGVFEVDPYLVNNWLVGLYVISEARLEGARAQDWAVPAHAPN